MIHKPEPDRHALLRDMAGITAAFQAAARDALERHKKLGESIVIWRDGRVVEVPPEEIDAELARAEREAGLR
ncbi:MAG: hypothetical protein NTY35_08365 [Planctomycetota bacterium]|nr:hypothetical protein [Planctomycetota bacterium]